MTDPRAVPTHPCCTRGEDGEIEGHFTVALHVAQELQAALTVAQARAAAAEARVKQLDEWLTALQREHEKACAEALRMRDLVGTTANAAIGIAAQGAQAKTDLTAERDTARAALAEAAAVLAWYADTEHWEYGPLEDNDDCESFVAKDRGATARAYLAAHPPAAGATDRATVAPQPERLER